MKELQNYLFKLNSLAFEFGGELGRESADALDLDPCASARLDFKGAMRDFSKNYFGGASLPRPTADSIKEGMMQGSILQFRNQGYKVTREEQKAKRTNR